MGRDWRDSETTRVESPEERQVMIPFLGPILNVCGKLSDYTKDFFCKNGRRIQNNSKALTIPPCPILYTV